MYRVIMFGLGLLLAGCSTASEPTGGGSAVTARAKDPARARTWIASGAAVIDVRTPEEFATGHVDRAVNIPVDQLVSRMPEVDRLARKDQPIVVYCASGMRAGKAERMLSQAGYSQVVNGGGVDDLTP